MSMTEKPDKSSDQIQSPLKGIIQPFIDVVHAPRALWGVNISYLLEGFCYFGVLGYLAMYFNQYVGLSDTQAGPMVGVLTWGITLSMFLFGGRVDKWGVRVALIASICLMVLGRVLLAGGPSFGLAGGLWSPLFFTSLVALLFVVLGYGLYQPAAYAAVRQFTTPKTAGMGYAMLYALMNLGGWLPTFFTPIRKSVGISGAYWVYVGFTRAGPHLSPCDPVTQNRGRRYCRGASRNRQGGTETGSKRSRASGAIFHSDNGLKAIRSPIRSSRFSSLHSSRCRHCLPTTG